MSNNWVGTLRSVTATEHPGGEQEVSIRVDWMRGGNFDGVIDEFPCSPSDVFPLLGSVVVVELSKSDDPEFDLAAQSIRSFSDFIFGSGETHPECVVSKPVFTSGYCNVQGYVGTGSHTLDWSMSASFGCTRGCCENSWEIDVSISDAEMWGQMIGYSPREHRGRMASGLESAVLREVQWFQECFERALHDHMEEK